MLERLTCFRAGVGSFRRASSFGKWLKGGVRRVSDSGISAPHYQYTTIPVSNGQFAMAYGKAKTFRVSVAMIATYSLPFLPR